MTQDTLPLFTTPAAPPPGMAGRTYLLAGEPVTVVCTFVLPSRARPLPACPAWLHWATPPPGAPRNVAVRHPDGRTVVRPARGLRRPA